MDASDVNVLLENEDNSNSNLDISEAEEIDDLESLKSDIGEVLFEEVKDKSIEASLEKEPEKNVEVINEAQAVEAASSVSSQGLEGKTKIFDVGNEEKELMEVAKYLEGKIPEDEWNEIATASKLERYVIQEGDWLWKICKKVFGSGFYYSKIWSLNPHIKNPHEIEPGMTLVFDTGDSTNLPEVQLGSFEETPGGLNKEDVKRETKEHFDFKKFGDDTKPDWIAERSKLIDEGIYFQYASEETYGDLAEIAKQSLKTEWEKYDPPVADIIISEPGEQYDDSGFDKDSKIVFDVKEGFYLNSFVTTNIVQDLGIIDASSEDQVYLQRFDPIYVKFDPSVKVKPGDLFSVYAPEGKVAHKV
ncbi:MAG: hypothetical protein ACJARO_001776, partial [Bacteriovoracaceae bacterium]